MYVLISYCRYGREIMPSKHGSYKTVILERNKKKSEQEGTWEHIIDSLVSHGYHQKTGLVNVSDLSVVLTQIGYILDYPHGLHLAA
jgi:hypothetical protein